jgi:MFS family permease
MGRSSFSVLRYRDYALFWSAAMVSNSGTWMQTIAVPFVLYRMTHSTTWLGVGAFMAFFPALLVGPLAGSLADRFPRKRILLVSQTGMMTTAFALWGMWIGGIASPELIVVLLFFAGIASGINIAAWQSFVPQLVPRSELLHAVRLNSMQFVAARAFGPALAGLVLQELGAGAAFLFNALSFVLVLLALCAIRPRPVPTDHAAGTVRAHFKEALRYVASRQALLLPVLTIGLLSFFGSAIVQLTPALARDEFGVGRGAYGLLVAAFGVGAIGGSLLVAVWADRYRRSLVALGGVGLFAVGELALGVAPDYGFGLAAMVVMGMAYLLVATALNTSIQARVDEVHRGRAMSIYLMGLLAGVPLGALLEGNLAELVGLRATVVGAAVGLVLSFALLAVRFDRFRPLDEALDSETVTKGPALLIDTPPAIAGAD